MPSIRWSTRLPWSSAVRLRQLVQCDAPGRIGDVLGRALGHLLDQPDAVVLSMVQHVADVRASHSLDRTQVVSVRIDPSLLARLQAWMDAHAGFAQSWVVDCAIRSYLQVCKGHTAQDIALSGLDARRYRRLSSQLVVIIDEAHAV
jgi:hypothetical protein